MPLSTVYDIFWIVEKSDEFWEDKSEGGMDQVIILAVYFMVIYKFILFLVMWKASLNFPKFVQ
jgi:hypothetical protein